MKLRCPLDTYQYISQTYAEHMARAIANGWAPYPTGVPGTVYYYGGIDYAVYNVPCKDTGDGVVSSVEYNNVGYGKCVRVNHGNGYVTIYAHLSSINVVEGQIVKAGDILGITGNTGNSTGPHLHFEVRLNNSPIDPQPMIDETESEDDVKGTVLVDGLGVRKSPEVSFFNLIKRIGKTSPTLEIVEVVTMWGKTADGNYVCLKEKGVDYVKLDE
jgi:hypothetical protein